jgi:molybdate transport system ATP-binding protein
MGEMDLVVDLEIEEGSFVAIMGKSGSGKTTLLRLIAGLEDTRGQITMAGKSWQGVPPQQRNIGFVFQDHALFTNMSVEENLLFVSRDRALAQELLEMTQLTHLANRRVTALSGGQQQRVSICRAMMRRPKLLLMDEPFSALDGSLKEHLQEQIMALHRRFGTTTLMVSHDTKISYGMADRIVVIDHGEVLRDGVPDEIFQAHLEPLYRFRE